MLPIIIALFLCIGLLPAAWCIDGLQGQSIKDAFGEFSLTDMISVHSQGIEYEEADDGFPSYKFFPTSDVKTSYRVLLPEKLYEFAILVKFLPNSPKGGYLFSVVNPLDTVVQLGLHLSPVIKNMWNVSLLYTQSDQNSVSRKLVSYQLPYRGKEWTTLSFQVLSDKVLFYYDCELNETTSVVREPQELVFDSASTLYLAQAGLILTGHFEPFGKVHMREMIS
ncbi:PREDICTED: collagen alpha-1(XVIII) chain-like isoform X2 [Rhagoletis zephyria]|uniref:collagen alpha-1(XVIII) chain-like isoform X2 n=1 Tax=Rhagoletis zephyria TaxID=28612 RepID=UPI00081175D7|nr:PREDICTED: collagen alpha-1(XVIII) chain-like isoform X2 [Rhagoletis zephyria]